MDKKNELDRVFSLYIRLRDANDNGQIRCISCGRIMPFSSFDCGHYYGRYYIATRWDEDNCHAECVRCNRMDEGHLDGYKENLVAKIGLRRVKALEVRHREMVQESDIDFDALIARYKAGCKKLAREKGIKINL